ncbi:MAG: hypothetical protein KME18_16715 [Phormidium tanganyikae FI6-MK23]|jgi:hypothetical protein|nr:hypothetical protein [Phormidium tanganyikae FI6-MK23]
MSKGFQSTDETKIQIALKRITPAAKRADIDAFADGLRAAQRRYGTDVAEEARQRALDQFPELARKAIEFLPEEAKSQLRVSAYSIIADVIGEAGLRIENHFRVCDRGVALTHAALKAIADTGFPEMAKLGKGSESLQGFGVDRANGFYHPLGETFQHQGEDCINSWGVASMLVSSAAGWIEDCDSEQGFKSLQMFVSQVAPTVDVQEMLRQSRYDDRSLLRLVQLASDGMTAKAQQSHEQR